MYIMFHTYVMVSDFVNSLNIMCLSDRIGKHWNIDFADGNVKNCTRQCLIISVDLLKQHIGIIMKALVYLFLFLLTTSI